jgi:hypothetical protein
MHVSEITSDQPVTMGEVELKKAGGPASKVNGGAWKPEEYRCFLRVASVGKDQDVALTPFPSGHAQSGVVVKIVGTVATSAVPG